MTRIVLTIACLSTWLLGPSFALAQNEAPVGPPATPKTTVLNKSPRKATLNFEDELVEGSTEKPELFYVFQKKNFNYKRLIKLRENFLPEMRETAEDIQRTRGSN